MLRRSARYVAPFLVVGLLSVALVALASVPPALAREEEEQGNNDDDDDDDQTIRIRQLVADGSPTDEPFRFQGRITTGGTSRTAGRTAVHRPARDDDVTAQGSTAVLLGAGLLVGTSALVRRRRKIG